MNSKSGSVHGIAHIGLSNEGGKPRFRARQEEAASPCATLEIRRIAASRAIRNGEGLRALNRLCEEA
jgi:hypothetical protein